MNTLIGFDVLNFFAGLSLILTSMKVASSLQMYVLDVPIILGFPIEYGLKEWRTRYKIQSTAHLSLTIITSISSITTFILMFNNSEISNLHKLFWLVGTILIISLGPYTFKIVIPINKRLNSKECDLNSDTASKLLKKWGQVNEPRPYILILVTLIFFSTLYIL